MKSTPSFFRQIPDAIYANNRSKVVRSLSQNLDLLNDETPMGTWLFMSIFEGHSEMVNDLLELGADINLGMTSPNRSPLQEACIRGHSEIVESLIRNGAEYSLSSQEDNPLFSAIGGGSIETVELLLKHGIDPTIRYEADDGMDAMSHAIIQGQREIGRRIALWIAGGDVEKGDSIYEAALDYVEEKIGEPLESRD